MVKGYIQNNTGKAKHIFKRTIFPGQKIELPALFKTIEKNLGEGESFIDYLQLRLPDGWELQVDEEEVDSKVYVRTQPEKSKASIVPVDERHILSGPEDDSPSLEYAPHHKLEKLTARDLYNLRMKDNPKRIIKSIDSVHKLRRALAMCKNDARKSMLANIIRRRIRELGSEE